MRRRLSGKEDDSEDEESKTYDSVLADIKQEPKDESQDSPEKGDNCSLN